MSTVQCPNCHYVVNTGHFCSNCAAPLIPAPQPQESPNIVQCLRCYSLVSASQYCSNCSATLPQPIQMQSGQSKPRANPPITVFIWSFVGLIIVVIVVASKSPLATFIALSGFVIMGWGLIGLFQGKLAYLPIEENKKIIMVFFGGCFIFVIGLVLGVPQKQTAESKSRETSQNSIASTPATPALPSSASQAPVSVSDLPPDPKQRAKESAEHLAEAKKALTGYNPKGKNPYWGRLKEAREHLAKIGATDKEYGESQKLLAEINRRESEIERFAKTANRRYYADELEKTYLSKGMDVVVSLSGADDTTIKMKYVLMSRPLVYQLTNDSSVTGKLRELGFKKIIFTDGYRSTWTYDLE